MTAQDYPITFGYGATDGIYYGPQAQGKATYIGPYHRGDDRAMPYGTPVVVNGVEIGKSGDGNGRYGAHLHIGKFINGSDVNPNGEGFSLSGAKVISLLGTYGPDPVNAKYVRIQDSSGAVWVYLHMSELNVSVGQTLEGADMGFWDSTIDNQEEERQVFLAWLGRNPGPQEVGRYVGKTVRDVWPDIAKNQTRTTVDPILTYVRDHNGQLPSDTDASAKLAAIKKLLG